MDAGDRREVRMRCRVSRPTVDTVGEVGLGCRPDRRSGLILPSALIGDCGSRGLWRSAEGRIRTCEPLRERVLSPPQLARLCYLRNLGARQPRRLFYPYRKEPANADGQGPSSCQTSKADSAWHPLRERVLRPPQLARLCYLRNLGARQPRTIFYPYRNQPVDSDPCGDGSGQRSVALTLGRRRKCGRVLASLGGDGMHLPKDTSRALPHVRIDRSFLYQVFDAGLRPFRVARQEPVEGRDGRFRR